ncbi:MAG: L-aspartate oxidase [Candidatus Petromonas sp.]|jgi:L-aspartate oxidase|nr:L-aspartate oxidase [Candidatus Petromonas sp.]
MYRRYLTKFDLDKVRKEYCNVLIIGTGIAGLYTAVNIDEKYKVLMLAKNSIKENNSNLAQGGIAACISKDNDKKFHYMDTLKAGSFYNNEGAVKILVEEAAENIEKLIEFGTNFDRDEKNFLRATKEGGHSRRRVLHSKDETGKEIIRALTVKVKKRKNIIILEDTFAIDILTSKGRCIGAIVKSGKEIYCIISQVVVLATGGIGQVYQNTTNSKIATGDGIAMAFRAGAEIVDMEFVQFHPTALYDENNKKRFLISEAVRGEGAILRNSMGEAFMKKYHKLKDLAPRDIVSRAIFNEMNKENKPCVFLDITHKDKDFIKNRFPNIYNQCLLRGIDITKDYIPVCPVEHYIMGGIKTNYNGRTNIVGLYACGEAACTGVHGANRLASNSLLEGVVFGNRVAKDINSYIRNGNYYIYNIKSDGDQELVEKDRIEELRKNARKIMEKHAFILRSKKGLEEALIRIKEILEELNIYKRDDESFYECVNIMTVAYLIVSDALKRETSLGSHALVEN